MTDIEKLYEKETGNDAKNIRFTAYSTWLEQKALLLQRIEKELDGSADRELRDTLYFILRDNK